ncbi:hypothetical protein ACWET9_14790 [Streptomyces sp. NPDC004059]|uniref:hypothetical protein n=1 Tax=Streptomyces sp. NPDC051896 TaxID=3155416 RepID=UPI003440D95F
MFGTLLPTAGMVTLATMDTGRGGHGDGGGFRARPDRRGAKESAGDSSRDKVTG